ncbi:MAG: hypothetical protein WCS43_16785, partial [Verrucomicrobiota bacterium]
LDLDEWFGYLSMGATIGGAIDWVTMSGGVDPFLDYQNTNNTSALIAAAISGLTAVVESVEIINNYANTIIYVEESADFTPGASTITTTLDDLAVLLQSSSRIRAGEVTNGSSLCEPGTISLTGGAGLLPPPIIS